MIRLAKAYVQMSMQIMIIVIHGPLLHVRHRQLDADALTRMYRHVDTSNQIQLSTTMECCRDLHRQRLPHAQQAVENM